MVNKRWCSDSKVLSKSCSTLVGTLFTKCKPFYSPLEFVSIVMAAVYVPPEANPTESMIELSKQISTIEYSYPDSLVLLLGDFNYTSLTTQLPKFKQQVNCKTRDKKPLDHCYSTIKHSYHAIPRTPLVVPKGFF